MGSFLDYLDDLPEFNQQIAQVKRKIVEKKSNEEPKKEKVFAINVEVRTVEGAQLVINKLNEWISKVEGEKPKPSFKIAPKKVIKGKPNSIARTIHESMSRAINILDGLPDEPVQMSEQTEYQSINNTIPQTPKSNLGSVTGHASALL